jgi:hypothetical protein
MTSLSLRVRRAEHTGLPLPELTVRILEAFGRLWP